MKTIHLDCTKMADRDAAHTYLAKTLGFPDWYGRNLDALYDLLCEFDPTKLVLEHTQALDALGSYKLALLDTLRDAAEENPNLELVEG